jgi:hypothetical protein
MQPRVVFDLPAILIAGKKQPRLKFDFPANLKYKQILDSGES